MSSLNSSFAFRTYEDNGLMLYHAFSSSGYVAVSLGYRQLAIVNLNFIINSMGVFIWSLQVE